MSNKLLWFGSLQHVKKQQATGRTKDGYNFPLTMVIKPKTQQELKKAGWIIPDGTVAYKGLVWVFANISGLISFTPDGVIQTCNHNFSLLLFGYHESELVGKVCTFGPTKGSTAVVSPPLRLKNS